MGTVVAEGEIAGEGRSAGKRRAIMEAATALFLRNGYQGTSMDEVAARAAVSKQTVYKHFADKERLFTDIVLEIADSSDAIIRGLVEPLKGAKDLEKALRDLARRYVAGVMQPQVIALRRLVIAEAERFPDLARIYYERGPLRAVDTLAAAFRDLTERGLLRADDSRLAAGQFAYLVLSLPLDKAMFHGVDHVTASELRRSADAGVRVFAAAYRA